MKKVHNDLTQSREDLHGADLHGADMRGAILSGESLRDETLREADLREADMREAVLRHEQFLAAERGWRRRWRLQRICARRKLLQRVRMKRT